MDFVLVISLVRAVHCIVSVSGGASSIPRGLDSLSIRGFCLFAKGRCLSVLQILFCVL